MKTEKKTYEVKSKNALVTHILEHSTNGIFSTLEGFITKML